MELLHVHIIGGRNLVVKADVMATVKVRGSAPPTGTLPLAWWRDTLLRACSRPLQFKPAEPKFLRATKIKKETRDPVRGQAAPAGVE
jgi:hypothetical protein